jgi:hypothetical protein
MGENQRAASAYSTDSPDYRIRTLVEVTVSRTAVSSHNVQAGTLGRRINRHHDFWKSKSHNRTVRRHAGSLAACACRLTAAIIRAVLSVRFPDLGRRLRFVTEMLV